jgi:hypothetical protein
VPLVCTNGTWVGACPAPDPTETVCNGIDDNCNGEADEGATDVSEVCDGADNNCDGNIDAADPDFVVPTTSCPGVGAECTFDVTAACIDGMATGTCPAPDASETICNGVDDDCNGRVDEGYQNQRESVVLEPGVCYTSTTYCDKRDGVERMTPPVFGTGGPEVPDGINNDCADDRIDECAPGQTDWWCTCAGGDVQFVVDELGDTFTLPDPNDPTSVIPDPETAASFCSPTSEPATGACTVRGVFRRAEQLDYLGCRVVATLPAGTLNVIDELRLSAGELVLRGAGSDPSQETCGPDDPVMCLPAATAITTTNPCTGDQVANGIKDCSCSASPAYRLINAITAQSPAGFLPGVTMATNAALSLSLEVEDLILRGGRLDLQANAGSGRPGVPSCSPAADSRQGTSLSATIAHEGSVPAWRSSIRPVWRS